MSAGELRDLALAAELPRIEAECGCELPPLSDPTPADRARRVLNCADPPTGRDAEICRQIAGE